MDKKFEMAFRSYAEALNIIKHHQWQYEVTVACPGPKIIDKSLGTNLHFWCFCAHTKCEFSSAQSYTPTRVVVMLF